jgi:hypothetical protein
MMPCQKTLGSGFGGVGALTFVGDGVAAAFAASRSRDLRHARSAAGTACSPASCTHGFAVSDGCNIFLRMFRSFPASGRRDAAGPRRGPTDRPRVRVRNELAD